MKLRRIISDNEADFILLSLAGGDSRRFNFPTDRTPPNLQKALTNAQDSDWVRLVDVVTFPASPGLWRIFRLTDAGVARLAAIKASTKAMA